MHTLERSSVDLQPDGAPDGEGHLAETSEHARGTLKPEGTPSQSLMLGFSLKTPADEVFTTAVTFRAREDVRPVSLTLLHRNSPCSVIQPDAHGLMCPGHNEFAQSARNKSLRQMKA